MRRLDPLRFFHRLDSTNNFASSDEDYTREEQMIDVQRHEVIVSDATVESVLQDQDDPNVWVFNMEDFVITAYLNGNYTDLGGIDTWTITVAKRAFGAAITNSFFRSSFGWSGFIETKVMLLTPDPNQAYGPLAWEVRCDCGQNHVVETREVDLDVDVFNFSGLIRTSLILGTWTSC
jgi:hypothetical protein